MMQLTTNANIRFFFVQNNPEAVQAEKKIALDILWNETDDKMGLF